MTTASLGTSREEIIEYYDKLTTQRLNEELKLYSVDELHQIRSHMFDSVWRTETLDSSDKKHWSRFFYKCFAVSILTTGLYKVSTNEDVKKLLKWNPSWDNTQFFKFVRYKKGMPFGFATTALLIPDISMNLYRAGLKRFHLTKTMKDDERVSQMERTRGEEQGLKPVRVNLQQINPLLPKKNGNEN